LSKSCPPACKPCGLEAEPGYLLFFLFGQGFNVGKYDEPDQSEQNNTETINVEKKDPRLTQAKNTEDNYPHRNWLKIFYT